MRMHPTKTLISRAASAAVKTFAAHDILWQRLQTSAMLAELDAPLRDECTRGRPEVYGNALAHLHGAHEAFRERLNRLSEVYDVVSRWWVVPTAPAFEARATSALEGVLWGAMSLDRHIDMLGPESLDKDVAFCWEFIQRFCPAPESREIVVLSALRRETAAILEAWRQETLTPIPALGRPSQAIGYQCSIEAMRHIPLGWPDMTGDQRWKALGDAVLPARTDYEPSGAEEAATGGRPRNPDALVQMVKSLRPGRTWDEVAAEVNVATGRDTYTAEAVRGIFRRAAKPREKPRGAPSRRAA